MGAICRSLEKILNMSDFAGRMNEEMGILNP